MFKIPMPLIEVLSKQCGFTFVDLITKTNVADQPLPRTPLDILVRHVRHHEPKEWIDVEFMGQLEWASFGELPIHIFACAIRQPGPTWLGKSDMVKLATIKCRMYERDRNCLIMTAADPTTGGDSDLYNYGPTSSCVQHLMANTGSIIKTLEMTGGFEGRIRGIESCRRMMPLFYIQSRSVNEGLIKDLRYSITTFNLLSSD
jgi:hypothetical protein